MVSGTNSAGSKDTKPEKEDAEYSAAANGEAIEFVIVTL